MPACEGCQLHPEARVWKEMDAGMKLRCQRVGLRLNCPGTSSAEVSMDVTKTRVHSFLENQPLTFSGIL